MAFNLLTKKEIEMKVQEVLDSARYNPILGFWSVYIDTRWRVYTASTLHDLLSILTAYSILPEGRPPLRLVIVCLWRQRVPVGIALAELHAMGYRGTSRCELIREWVGLDEVNHPCAMRLEEG
jgi:hypothetical protein